MKKRRIRGTLAVLTLLILLLPSCIIKKIPRHYSGGPVMGTFCDLTFIPSFGLKPDQFYLSSVLERMYYLENLWSIYRKESELSTLNRMGKVKASPETLFLIREAEKVSRISDGAFDITVSPLMSAWKEAEKKGRPPDLKPIIPLVDYRKIKVEKDGTVSFLKKGMAIDPGGIGKGLAVDAGVSVLKSSGVKSGLVNLGGNIFGFGEGPHRGRWKVGIRNPKGEGVIYSVMIRNQGVSTSGNYERFLEVNGKKYSHILDPRQGLLARYPESVTVVAPTAGLADGLSTAFFVLGPEKGMAITQKMPGVEAFFIMADGRQYATKGFPFP